MRISIRKAWLVKMNEYDLSANIWEELLPEFEFTDRLIHNLLPDNNIDTMDMVNDVLKGNWVLEPGIFFKYIKNVVSEYLFTWKNLFVSIFVLFIAAAIVNTFMSAFKNNGAAKSAGIFFLLCQMLVLINAYNEMQDIMTNAINEMVDFLKIMLPAYMICVASTGYGMSAMIFYKLLLGFLCLLENVILASLVPIVEGYMLLGLAESIWNEERLRPLTDTIYKSIQGILKISIMIFSVSSILQVIVTPVIDKANIAFVEKTAGAIPAIGDIAESVSNVMLISATAIKNSVGVVILVLLILMMAVPIINIAIIWGTIKISSVLGAICGEKSMTKCSEYISNAGYLLIRILVTVTSLFFVSIAAIINSTGI